MTKTLRNRLRRFRKNEDGNSSIEFIFWFPFFLYVAYSGMDLGLQSFHHADLERSLDMTIREVRLNRLPEGEDEWDHALLKKMICDEALITNCSENLALEMKSIDPRVGNQLDPTPYCVDTPETIRKPDEVVFEQGTSNELMIIRACLEVSPVFGLSMLSGIAKQDNDGQWELQATTVFVHEPFGGSSADPDDSSDTTVDVADASN
ncbi:hypothetical protein I5192_04405 [Ruegeria sp. SCSIO 43209]|uniref:TadE/TadG family type IV pilus assembly protein n=1 Tax=Ruegeria sp. SCSIO 43209 TaxID=2793010 RepID=UPI00148047CD|nr:hypothetical protein [Ruegeria sp. SCSIO 43209]UAB89927.1 hypothetical protein I5192_04405 [Ruegeria sp. SCSIO 43209]